MSPLSFYENILFSSIPEEVETNEIRAQGTPGEMVSLSFFVSADEDRDELKIGISELSNDLGCISQDLLDIYVVKIWEQAGISIYISDPVQVAELLVKDDRLPFHDHYSRRCAHWKNPLHWRHLLRPPKFYCPPSVRLQGLVHTNLKARQKKQFWISIKIPNDAVAGIYEGHIQFGGKRSSSKGQQLRVQLEVLPIQLLQTPHDFCIWYKGTLDCLLSQHHVPEAIFESQLRDIYEHGFTSFSLTESKAHFLQKALDIAHRIGFRRNVILLGPWPENIESVDFKGLTPIYYLSDEADFRGEPFVRAHHDNWRKVKGWGGTTMASIIHEAKAKELFLVGDENMFPDVYAIHLANNLHYFAIRSEFAIMQEKNVYYYWLSHMEKPNVHRVLAGLYLWKSRSQGFIPYGYQHLPGKGASPFDDFALQEDEAPVVSDDKPRKALMTTYPAATGSIPTLQWKGISAGITDLKYLTTLNAALESAENQQSPSPELQTLVQEIRESVAQFMERLSLTRIEIRLPTQREPYLDIAPGEYQKFKEQMARDIIRLQNALNVNASGASPKQSR
ncbi:hypothetical protein IAD21_05283 [Abditibacteriota bacterium]|nr:hypothetical protein IAD21_05283 [Abditibacteriota bacterium]